MQDYLQGRARGGQFYSGSPFDLNAFRRKLAEVQGRFGASERQTAAACLRPVSDNARRKLDAFLARGGVIVTTGQQAGFLTGPLFTIHKALTAIRLAETLEARLRLPVLPVFWIASEDHDWDEVNHAFLADPTTGLRRISLPSSSDLPLPMNLRVLGDGVRTVLDTVTDILSQQSFAEPILTSIREAYRPGRTVAGAFGDLLAELLAGFDLCLVDAADPRLKRASASVLARALTGAREHEAVLERRTAELAAAGYGAQVAIMEGATNVFHNGRRGRERLEVHGTGVRARETGTRWEGEELRKVMEEAPEDFSPNVLLRPVVESAVFPTLAYVGGPGEMRYFAQANALFPEFGMTPPVVYPRASMLLVEGAIQRLLAKLDLGVPSLRKPVHELEEGIARRAMSPELGSALEELRESVARGYREVMNAAGEIDPTLMGSLGGLRNEVLARLGEGEKRIVRQLKRTEDVAMGQLRRVRENLRPNGASQERVLNVIPFVARHGPGLLHAMAKEITVPIEEGVVSAPTAGGAGLTT